MVNSQSLREGSQKSDIILCTLAIRDKFSSQDNNFVNFVESDMEKKLTHTNKGKKTKTETVYPF